MKNNIMIQYGSRKGMTILAYESIKESTTLRIHSLTFSWGRKEEPLTSTLEESYPQIPINTSIHSLSPMGKYYSLSFMRNKCHITTIPNLNNRSPPIQGYESTRTGPWMTLSFPNQSTLKFSQVSHHTTIQSTPNLFSPACTTQRQ
jgi:hypothetical protein